MSANPDGRPAAAIFGCAGTQLLDSERRFFEEVRPLGFILFERNCKTPDQIRDLVRSLRSCTSTDAPVLIDQEGGRVARLKPPHWRALPPAGRIGLLARDNPEAGREAAFTVARLIAADLEPLGIDVDCAPVLDVPAPDSHSIIGDRAFATEPDLVADLGLAFCKGLIAGGVLPVIKHIPGHGRAMVDSHLDLPEVAVHRQTLEAIDFAPFRALSDMPYAMTAHVIYRAFDGRAPATTSGKVVADVIRRRIGFEGFLMTDDITMRALKGSIGGRAKAAIAAGCDAVLHSDGKLKEMQEVAAACGTLTDAAMARFAHAKSMRRRPEPVDGNALAARLNSLLSAAAA